MVIDTSALIALLLGEAETINFVAAIAAASSRAVSAPTYLETAIVVAARLGSEGLNQLNQLIADLAVEIVPFDQDQAALAIEAYRRFGKGNHAAGLNFGDCFTYALAKARDAPVLFKGRDFSLTDLSNAVAA